MIGFNRRARCVCVAAVVVVASIAGVFFATNATIAAENVYDGSADPSVVDETTKQKHTFKYTVDNVSNDGSSDLLYLTFPDRINQSTNDLSSFSGNVTNANTGESVSISSSPSIVDGPDGDGVKDTVQIGIQPEGERKSIDVVVRFTGYVTWPNVSTTTDLPVKAAVTDSKYADVPPTTFTAVTVEDEDAGGSTTTTETTTESTTKTTSETTTTEKTTGTTATTGTTTETAGTTETTITSTTERTTTKQAVSPEPSTTLSDGSPLPQSNHPLVVFGGAGLLLAILGLGTMLIRP